MSAAATLYPNDGGETASQTRRGDSHRPYSPSTTGKDGASLPASVPIEMSKYCAIIGFSRRNANVRVGSSSAAIALISMMCGTLVLVAWLPPSQMRIEGLLRKYVIMLRNAFDRAVHAAPAASPSASTPGWSTMMPYLSENWMLPGDPAQWAQRMKFEFAAFSMRIVYSCIHSGVAAPSPA